MVDSIDRPDDETIIAECLRNRPLEGRNRSYETLKLRRDEDSVCLPFRYFRGLAANSPDEVEAANRMDQDRYFGRPWHGG